MQAGSNNRWLLMLSTAAALIALLTLEIATEEGGFTTAKLVLEILELLLFAAFAGGVVLLLWPMRRQPEARENLMRYLEAARGNGAGWRGRVQSHLDGLSEAVRSQLQQWKLSEAEGEVALLILRGLGDKEIAVLRGASESAVREHARGVCQKAGLQGRAALCAFFFDDLLPVSGLSTPASPTIDRQAASTDAPRASSD